MTATEPQQESLPAIPDFVPTCRYGHGPLEKQGDEWGLQELNLTRLRVMSVPDGRGTNTVAVAPYAYAVNIYRCPVCRYVELFDIDPENGAS